MNLKIGRTQVHVCIWEVFVKTDMVQPAQRYHCGAAFLLDHKQEGEDEEAEGAWNVAHLGRMLRQIKWVCRINTRRNLHQMIEIAAMSESVGQLAVNHYSFSSVY